MSYQRRRSPNECGDRGGEKEGLQQEVTLFESKGERQATKKEGTKGLGKLFYSGCLWQGTRGYGDARRDLYDSRVKILGNDESEMISIHDTFQEI